MIDKNEAEEKNGEVSGLGEIYNAIKLDYSRYTQKPGSKWKYFYKALSHPGFRAVLLYRFGNMFWKRRRYHLAGLMERIIFHTCYAEISVSAEIGPGFLISHTVGLVIGGQTRIGQYCDVRQNVTFGGNFNKTDGECRSQPWLENNISVGSGAVIIGPVKVCSNSIIGANSVVTHDIPENVIVSGIPGKVIKERWSPESPRSL